MATTAGAPPELAPPGTPVQNRDGTWTYPDGTRTPVGYQPDPNTPPGYVPHFDANGVLAGWKDPNGHVIGSYDGAKANPDGSITYPSGNGGFLVTRPDGTASQTISGITTNWDANGKATNARADGSAATPDDVQAANNRANPSPAGGILGFRGNVDAGGKILQAAGSGASDLINSLTKALGGGSDLSVDTSGVQKDIDVSRALRDQFDAAYRAAHPGTAPKIDPTTLGPQTLATAAGPATSVGGTAGHADASLAAASLLDPTQQAQFRTQQQGLADYLNTVIAGKTPSVAQLQMLDTLQKNEANQLGIASKGSGGGNAFLALQNAANQIGRLNQGASSDSAMLRAKEEADARAELANVLGQARTSDITMADRNASLSTDVSKTNATNQTSTSNANAGRDTDVSLAKAAADNAAALQHERELNSISTANAGNATNLNINQGTITSGEKKADASNILTQQEQDEKAKQDAAANAINSSGQAITGGGNLVDSIAKIQAAKAKATNDAIGQIGSAFAWAANPGGKKTS